jgi:hypothetical protein
MNKLPFCSIIVLNYNEKEYLRNCLSSLLRINYPKNRYKIVLVDNGSSDDSVNFVRKTFLEIKIIQNKNIGFSAGNNVALRSEKGDYLILLNADTVVDKNWLVELVKVAETDKSIGLCTSKLLMLDNKTIINSAGGIVHFLGFSWPRGLFIKDKNQFNKIEETSLASGASLLIRKNILKKVGYFDESYFLYGEDTDYTWRVRLAGFKTIFVPNSVVYHKYSGSIKKYVTNIKKFYYLERSRITTLLKNYSLHSLLILFPSMIVMETSLILYFIYLKSPLLKFKVYSWILKNFRIILKNRKNIQKTRKIDDKELIQLFTSEFSYFTTSPLVLKILNPIINLYWKIVKNLI